MSGVLTDPVSFVRKHVRNDKLVKHMIAVGAIMRALARKLGEDEEKWWLTGVLHDVDFELTKDDPSKHGLASAEILKGLVPEDVLRAIKAHNFERTGVLPETRMEKALIAADAASGLLVACALVMPSKKMAEVRLKTVLRKFKEKSFAPGARRDRILFCEQIGLTKEEFLGIALEALKEVAGELGL